jgi:hypothetical protein
MALRFSKGKMRGKGDWAQAMAQIDAETRMQTKRVEVAAEMLGSGIEVSGPDAMAISNEMEHDASACTYGGIDRNIEKDWRLRKSIGHSNQPRCLHQL